MIKSSVRPPMRLFFTMVRKPSGEWSRVGKAYFNRKTATGWLPFVRGAWIGCSVKVSQFTIRFDQNGNPDSRSRSILDVKYNMDAP